MHMFMGLVAQMVEAMVASSSLVGGSGTLQFDGIRSHVVAWALMGREDAVIEVGFLLPRSNQKILDRKPQSSKIL